MTAIPFVRWSLLPRTLLICLFLVGLYTNYTIQVSAKVPFPSAPSGVAGLILLWRRRNLIAPAHFACLVSLLR